MKNFKRKSIHLALAAGIGASSMAMAGGPGNGMYINADGTGQVLLYPYYTTRGGMDTYLSLVNTTGEVKAVKVRFVESRNSREVLDFNLYLSPYDMWTAAVVDTGSGAKVVTADKSCTTPAIPAGGQAFVNYAYTGTVDNEDKIDSSNPKANGINIGGADGETASLDRTREGYIEIIEMGEIHNEDYVEYITHADGVPDDCSKLQGLKSGDELKLNIGTPTGGLTGSASLIAPGSGTDFSYDPVAIDNFAYHEIWHQAGSIEPDLRHGRNRSLVFYDQHVVDTDWFDTGEYEGDDWSKDSVNAVNALLMHRAVINEFVLDNVTLSGTDWVVTMPTKRYSVPIKDPNNSNHDSHHALPPFTSTFWENGACEPVDIEYYDREERTKVVGGFSPPPPGVNNALCWEANVITFNDSNILSSAHSVNIAIAEGFQNGWVRMHFDADGQKQSSNNSNHTYYGLPVIGFMVQDFVNLNAAPGVMATYGGSFKHKYETSISGSLQVEDSIQAP
ncbi:hypothetical protein [Candidatus Nitrotoga fabula]|uniref:Uncharacterized protein n=1 Tax=Candidatus Nitrotoga fabula TaxID=2182327 RepID=A0A916BCN2_9PROT|nr:hypothetical protein [Candidatus Nitrotoga fabula]CAE6691527.1 conserved exported hypothetical protein [Candidatus Nitrotoga fabula]